MAFKSVDFPAPLLPITVTKSPSFNVRFTPCKAFFSLTLPGKKVFFKSLITNMSVPSFRNQWLRAFASFAFIMGMASAHATRIAVKSFRSLGGIPICSTTAMTRR